MSSAPLHLSYTRFFRWTIAAFTLLYGAEGCLRVFAPRVSKRQEVLRLRALGEQAYPAVTASQVLMTSEDTPPLLPLGGVSHTKTIFCQEADPFLSYTSDRYGFNNPDSLWDLPALEVALVGDSFAQGACVPAKSSLQAQLNAKGISALSLGSYGNGPLSNLATIREYLHRVKPKTVFWVHVPNDLGNDLPIERTSPLLQSYLYDSSATQHLIERTQESDTFLKGFLDKGLAQEATLPNGAMSLPAAGTGISGFTTGPLALGAVFYYTSRLRLSMLGAPPLKRAFEADYDQAELPFKDFETILATAQGEVASWGGKLVVITIADAQMYTNEEHRRSKVAHYNEHLSEVLRGLKIPEISVFSMLQNTPDQYKNYAAIGPYYGHFNSRGYELLGAEIIKALRP